MNIRLEIRIILVMFLACIFLGSGCAGNSNLTEKEPLQQIQDEDVNLPPKATFKEIFATAKQDSKKLPGKLWSNTKATFTKTDNIAALLLAGGASVVLHQEADENVADYFDKHQILQSGDNEAINLLGHPTIHSAAAGLWYFLSIRDRNNLNKERAWTMRNALTITFLTTAALKTIRHNKTPNDNNRAWPSGHTASSFTVASVLDEYYGPKVGIPAYILASLVGYRMIDTGDHWGSDVVFGATLGWVVGHTVAGPEKDLKIAGFDIVPYVPQTEKPAFGISFVKRF